MRLVFLVICVFCDSPVKVATSYLSARRARTSPCFVVAGVAPCGLGSWWRKKTD